MTTKYEALAQAIRQAIADGVYRMGELLPTEEALTARFGVSRQTVRRALALLADEGVIEKRQGSGSRVTGAMLSTRRRSVAVMLTYPDEYIYPMLLSDMKETLAQSGYETVVFPTENRIESERETLRRIADGGFSGVIAEGVKTALPNPNLDLYAELRSAGVPLVFLHGAYPTLGDAARVDDGNYDGAYMLTRYLIGRGHTRIGGIFKSDDEQGHRRYLGYVTALIDAHMPVPDEAVMWFSTGDKYAMLERGDMTRLRGYIRDGTKELSAVVAYNDEMAFHLIRELTAAQIDVPEKLAVVSFDNSHYCALCPVPITSLGHDGASAGTAAAELLLDAISGKAPSVCKLQWTLHRRMSG